jgi:phage shock protein A
MIVQKFFQAIRAQLNKLANLFWEKDPIAQMRYEYDKSVEQLKEGRTGLEMYRGLVERVARQVTTNRSHLAKLEAQVKAYLKAGDRATASRFALEMEKAKTELKQNEEQLAMHEQSYENNLKKIQHAHKNLLAVREKIQKYDAELKMSSAEAEIAKLAEALDFNVTTDFGQIEDVIQRRIDENRGKVRVSADLSSRGVAEIEAEERMEASLAEDALRRYEVDLGLRAPETTPLSDTAKNLGPAEAERATDTQTN